MRAATNAPAETHETEQLERLRVGEGGLGRAGTAGSSTKTDCNPKYNCPPRDGQVNGCPMTGMPCNSQVGAGLYPLHQWRLP